MEYRRLGRSGLKVSALSFGSWVTFKNQVDLSLATECMKLAYDAGVNFFDNAEAYAHGESETIMGQVLKKMGWGRDTYCVSSKVFWGGKRPTQRGLCKKHVMDAAHAALQRMKLDYLDLYFCHRPDEETPVEETVRAMDVLIRQGKVLYWGTSEWSAQQIMEAHAIARQNHLTPPTMEQPEYNMFQREKVESEFRRLFSEVGLGLTTWSPLASGILTGKYANGIPSDSRLALPSLDWLKKGLESPQGRIRVEKAKVLCKAAEQLETTPAKLAIAWCLKNPNVSTVILGASKSAQLKENLAALEVLPLLDDEVMETLETVLQNKPAPLPEY